MQDRIIETCVFLYTYQTLFWKMIFIIIIPVFKSEKKRWYKIKRLDSSVIIAIISKIESEL